MRKSNEKNEETAKITIDVVARHAGVSKGTVSAVINEKNSVHPDTRQAVLSAMRVLNYRPKGSARNLKIANSEYRNIGLLVRELDNPFYTGVASGVVEYARSKGYFAVITSSEGDHSYEERITTSFTVRDVKGAVIAPVMEGRAEINHLFRLKTMNFPFVLLEDVKGIQANVVSIDNLAAMREAMNYLFHAGHSRIIHFAGPSNAFHTYERIESFRKAFGESNYTFRDDMIVTAGAHMDDGYKKCMEYFQKRDRSEYPTAIVCYNDLVALGVMAALTDLHIAIPDEVSVVGNDDIPFSRHAPVQLSTIRAPLVELGRRAADILIRNIESSRSLPVENIKLQAQFVLRESTTPVRPETLGGLRKHFPGRN